MLEHVGEGVIPLAVVKGNGYGHGLTVAAQVFLDSGFKELGVADLNEAITLRQVCQGRGPALCPAAHAPTQGCRKYTPLSVPRCILTWGI